MIQPFVGEFRSRDRAFAYIGTQGEEQGRLIFYNLTQQKKTVLTPSNLTVVDFKFYPKGDRILFSAADRSLGFEGLRQLQLYSIPTIASDNPNIPLEPQLLLDNKDYQNNQFDISADGKIIVVQRVNRQNPADFDLWMLKEGEDPQRLKVTGGDFRIAPDSKSLAVAKGEGIGILPLQPNGKPLDFLPKFGQLLSFSPDGTAATVVNFNTDNAKMRYTRSLFYVNNKGVQKELLTTEGSIINCQFNGTNTEIYCLLTQLAKGKDYREQPYFTKIDLKTGQVIPLATLPEYRDTKVSLSPDGLALLFDQVLASNQGNSNTSLSTNAGESVVGGKLWLLIPPVANSEKQKPDLKVLPLEGFRPQWAP
jgi:dipeptidyl aminopeptidase/acylaminoacyl peptidase